MSEIATILLLTIASASCMPLGGHLASFEHIRARWLEQELRHFLIALGGGILVGAVAVVLVPQGVASMGGSMLAIPIVLAGGLATFVVERAFGLRRREAPQMTGMLLDAVPESVALGGLVALGSPTAPLLALLIGLQNLPEGFNLETAVGRARWRVWVGDCHEATRRQAGACNEKRHRQARDQACQWVRSVLTRRVNANEGRKLSIHAASIVAISGQLRFLGSMPSANCTR